MMDNKILRNAHARIAGVSVGGLWRPRLDDDNYVRILHQMMEHEKTPLWRGVDDVPFMIEVHDIEDADERPDGTLDYRLLCAIERPDRMPLALYMKPVRAGDDRFIVYAEAVPPSVVEGAYDEHFSHQYHYLLHEIAFRVGLAMCYESTNYDNETIKMLMCVMDCKKYENELDIQMFETRTHPIRMKGLSEEDPFEDSGSITDDHVRLDELLFSTHIEPDTMPDGFNDEGDTIEKVVAYKDIRPIQEFGKDDWWVEMIRCPNCNQRVKVSLSKAQCPDGVPAVKIACKWCKLSFSHL